MSDEESKKDGAPTHIAYTVRNYGEDKADWLKCGVAFKHRDGLGFNVVCQASPIDGRLVLREVSDKEPTANVLQQDASNEDEIPY